MATRKDPKVTKRAATVVKQRAEFRGDSAQKNNDSDEEEDNGYGGDDNNNDPSVWFTNLLENNEANEGADVDDVDDDEEKQEDDDDGDGGKYDEDGTAVNVGDVDFEDNDSEESDEPDHNRDEFEFEDPNDEGIFAKINGIGPTSMQELLALEEPRVGNELIEMFKQLSIHEPDAQSDTFRGDGDDGEPTTAAKFRPNSDSLYSSAQFANDLRSVADFNHIGESALHAMVTFLHEKIPEVNWPLNKRTKRTKLIDRNKDVRSIVIDACPNQCGLFILNHKTKHKCWECGTYRYTPCEAKVQGLRCTDIDCNPNIRETGKYHHATGRRSVRNIYYRTIIALFKEIVRLSCVEGKTYLYDELKHGDVPLEEHPSVYTEIGERPANTLYVHDICGSANAKLHKSQMKSNYEYKKTTNPQLIDASFLISEFYDAGTLFGRRSISIRPLIITILNASPEIRLKPGLGMYLVALHDLSEGSGAEQSIFNDLFVPELNELYNGIEFSFQDANDSTVHVFLQVRLVCHVLDTIALMSTFHLYGE